MTTGTRHQISQRLLFQDFTAETGSVFNVNRDIKMKFVAEVVADCARWGAASVLALAITVI